MWDPVSGEQVANLEGHHGVINALCSITAGGRTLLASSGDDRTVRIWDPLTSRCAIVVPVHRVARAMASVNGSVAVGLDAGILVMKLGIVTKLQDKGQQGNGAVIGRS
jgi:WD40 repeat protein